MAQSTVNAVVAGKLKTLSANNDRVIVEPDLAKSKTILIPTQARDRQQATTGTIVAVGQSETMAFPFKVGDRVIFSRYAGIAATFNEVDDDGNDVEKIFHILHFADVSCSFTEERNEHQVPA